MKKLISILLSITLVLSVMVTGVFTLPINAATCTANKMNVYQKKVTLPGAASTNYHGGYSAVTPKIVSFVDGKGSYNIAYPSGDTLYIYRYNKNLKLTSTLEIPFRLSLFGNVTFDENGNYYVCWGEKDTKAKNIEVIRISKYNYQGVLRSECKFKGYDTSPYTPEDVWGTKLSFDAGTCAMSVNNGVLTCNFAREMYSGHQSNYVVYVKCSTMKRIEGEIPYVSHSFDQDCISTSDGGFLLANHGDAYNRSFVVSKISPSNYKKHDVDTFHFREGTNRKSGYNETYAQLGGLAETQKAYVLCASSERTLSLNVAPTKKNYCSYSEARDLFVQILKKDFYNYSRSKMYVVEGKTRKATGTAPKNPKTELWLSKGTTDYGVVWITNYSDDYFVANPKIVSIGNRQFVIMWEKRYASEHSSPNELPVATFYMIMRDDGTIVQRAKSIGKIGLPTDADVIYNNGSILWVTSSGEQTSMINVLDIEGHSYAYKVTKKATCAQNGQGKYVCTKCSDVWDFRGVTTLEKLKHTYDNVCDADCNVCGTTRKDAHIYKHYKTVDATTSANGKKYYKCEECAKTKTTTIYMASECTLSTTQYTYDGVIKKPIVRIYDSQDNKLTYGEDYTYTRPSGSKNVGKYRIKVTFKGDYSGTKDLQYVIYPPKTSVSSITAGQKSLKVTLEQQSTQTSGYEIQYATSNNFTSAKSVTVSGYSNTTVKLNNLIAKKTYYVRVRTYKIVNGVRYCSLWSGYKYKATQ